MTYCLRDRLKIGRFDAPSPFIAIQGKRENVLELLEVEHASGKDGFLISMPCGYDHVFTKPDDIPHSDLPCPCGNQGEYLIKLT